MGGQRVTAQGAAGRLCRRCAMCVFSFDEVIRGTHQAAAVPPPRLEARRAEEEPPPSAGAWAGRAARVEASWTCRDPASRESVPCDEFGGDDSARASSAQAGALPAAEHGELDPQCAQEEQTARRRFFFLAVAVGERKCEGASQKIPSAPPKFFWPLTTAPLPPPHPLPPWRPTSPPRSQRLWATRRPRRWRL